MFAVLPKAVPQYDQLPHAPLTGLVDDRSFEEEAAALRPLVRAVVAAVLAQHRTHPDVEDCTHESLRRAIEGKSRLRQGEPLGPWVSGIARHVALDARRKMQRERLRAEPARSPDSAPAVEAAADPGPTPYERLADAEEKRKVLAAIDALPDGPRRALGLLHGEGLAYGEIAARLGVPLGTVATWIARGRTAVTLALGLGREDA